MKKAFRIIGLSIFLCSLVPLGLAWWSYNATTKFINQAHHAEAVVSSIEQRIEDDKTYYYPKYSFTDINGQDQSIISSTGYGLNCPKEGSHAWFYYIAKDPEDARKDSFQSLWLLPLLGAIGGAIPFLLGLFSFFALPILVKDVPISQVSSPSGQIPLQNLQQSPPSPHQEKMWAIASHLSSFSMLCGIPFGNIFAPLTIWLIHRETYPGVNFHGRESINFQLSMTLYCLICLITIVGILFIPALCIFGIVQVVRASICANNMEHFRYPFIIRFFTDLKPTQSLRKQ